MKRAVIIGAGDAARMTSYILGLYEDIEIIGFIDNDESTHKSILNGYPVLGSDKELEHIYNEGTKHAIIGIGNPGVRCRIFKQLSDIGYQFINAIHPTAIFTPSVKIGKGVIVLPGCIIADDPIIKDNVFIGQGVVIGHGSVINNDCLIGGRASLGADVDIDERVLVGWASVIGPKVKVGKDSIIGAGAVVLSDTADKSVMVGNPARIVKYNE